MKYIPMEKRSKKERKEYFSRQRGSWGGINPVTRRVPGKTGYDREKIKQADRRSDRDLRSACFL